MRTLILALAAAATLGLAAPAFASEGAGHQTARGGKAVETQSSEFSSRHRQHWRYRPHRWRQHYGWGGAQRCQRVWRYGHWVTVCRW